jgi:hydrogenase maturation protease
MEARARLIERVIPSARTLLVGMGNPILTDDAVGVRLVRDLVSRLGTVPGHAVMDECSVGGLDLVEHFAGHERIIVVDSIRTRGGTPGSWYRFTAANLRETLHLSNVHDANFATAIELGRRMGIMLPPDEAIHVFAVEVLENTTFGETFSPEIEEAYPEILEEILAEVRVLVA